jgi:hypothetical protein
MPQAALPLVGLAAGALGSGGSQSTSTSTTSAPEWALPAMQDALQRARVANLNGPNADQTAAMDALRRRSGGSPLNAAAGGAVMGLLDSGPNPYLDATFNQAADATRSRFSSEFARGGRDVSAAAPFREAELTNLATNIYGGAYDSDQQRRLAAAGLAPTIAGQDYQDINALLQAGQIPGSLLDQYIGRIGGIVGNQGTTTGVQQMPGNPMLGALGGFSLLGGQDWINSLIPPKG